MSGPGVSRFLDLAATPPGEFSDRLNPVFVRELRRALRTSFFVGGFVTLQAVTFVAALIESGISSLVQVSGSGDFISGLVGGATMIAFGDILPFANLGSLRNELGEGRNGELLVTAGLSSWQIVGGRVLVAVCTGAILHESIQPVDRLHQLPDLPETGQHANREDKRDNPVQHRVHLHDANDFLMDQPGPSPVPCGPARLGWAKPPRHDPVREVRPASAAQPPG